MDTPFNSESFVKTWLKHFKNSISPLKFEFIDGVQFYRNKYFPLYINIGKNLTKGFHYHINPKKIKNNHNVYLIYDIPSYYDFPKIIDCKYLKLKVIGQYNGYLTSLKNYNTIDDFFKANYSASGRNVLRRRQKALTNSFNIKYKMYYGSIEMDEYNKLFDIFYDLLKKRFKEKQTDYHIISKWDYIKELTYPMILNKEAAFFVIFDDDEPIAFQLNIHHNRNIIGSIPTYDTAYYKFGLGNILTFKLIEWCLEHKMDIYDSSKGDYGIKKQISDTTYKFDYHVLYNPKSFTSKLLSAIIISFFTLKQYLREKNIHSVFHRIKFKVLGAKNVQIPGQLTYEIVNEEFDVTSLNNLILFDYKKKEHQFTQKIVYNFLYKTGENKNDTRIYKQKDADIYFIIGKLHQQKALLINNAS